MEKVSVLLPVHNGERFIKETIDSVLIQDCLDEVLVVDNGSTDKTQSIVQELQRTDVRIRYFYLSKPGISNALNFGLNSAQNELIARIDADDKMLFDRLRIQADFLSQNSDVAVVGSQITFIDQAGKEIGHSAYPKGPLELFKHFTFRNPVAHPSVMFRKSAILASGGYRSAFDGAEDLDLWIRIIGTGSIFILNQELTAYRIHPSQVSIGTKSYIYEKNVRLSRFKELSLKSTPKETVFAFLQLGRVLDLYLMKIDSLKGIRKFLKKLLFSR